MFGCGCSLGSQIDQRWFNLVEKAWLVSFSLPKRFPSRSYFGDKWNTTRWANFKTIQFRLSEGGWNEFLRIIRNGYPSYQSVSNHDDGGSEPNGMNCMYILLQFLFLIRYDLSSLFTRNRHFQNANFRRKIYGRQSVFVLRAINNIKAYQRGIHTFSLYLIQWGMITSIGFLWFKTLEHKINNWVI